MQHLSGLNVEMLVLARQESHRSGQAFVDLQRGSRLSAGIRFAADDTYCPAFLPWADIVGDQHADMGQGRFQAVHTFPPLAPASTGC
jgi:hypothetical protein